MAEVETWLWRRAQVAVRRYFRSIIPAKSELGLAHQEVERLYWRTGWIMGYRAGRRSGRFLKHEQGKS